MGKESYNTDHGGLCMLNHLKRMLLQHLMNRYILRLRPVPRSNTDTSKPRCSIEQGPDRVERLLSSMTLQEKIDYISGVNGFSVRAVPRLGLPPVWMSDASSGVRGIDAPVTIFPSPIAMAASWNRLLIEELGRCIGQECRAIGVSLLLAPGVNLARVPICGRNFEYMGEDPFLTGDMARSYVRGVQSQQVGVTVKHFACNNSEYDRHKSDSVVDERTLNELYLSPFETVVQDGVTGIMTAYNLVNGMYSSEHSILVERLLREKWAFSGVVVSDWNSLYSTRGPLRCGVDIEMPEAKWYTQEAVQEVLKEDDAFLDRVEGKVRRLLTVFDSLGVLDRPVTDTQGSIGTKEHANVARRMASESIVLLKNEGLLPLAEKEVQSIVIIGRFTRYEPIGGGGSSFIKQGFPGLSIAEELEQRFPACTVTSLEGRWWRREKQRALVRDASVVIASVGFDHIYESEAYDRQWPLTTYDLRVIREACALNFRTVVLQHAGSAVEMASWVFMPQAILHCWYLGQSSALAIVDTLFGVSNPSGRLVVSFAHNLADYEAMHAYPTDYDSVSFSRIQGGQGDPLKRNSWPLVYGERLMVGYRQFDTVGPKPLFPFGFGLSYTHFSYTDMSLSAERDSWRVSCTVTNTGDCNGAEVVQLYVRPEQFSREHPFQQLRGFEKVYLRRNESTRVSFVLGERSFSVYQVGRGTWQRVAGNYTVALGSSSRDIRLSSSVWIKDPRVPEVRHPGEKTV